MLPEAPHLTSLCTDAQDNVGTDRFSKWQISIDNQTVLLVKNDNCCVFSFEVRGGTLLKCTLHTGIFTCVS